MTMVTPPSGGPELPAEKVENEIELREVAGLSQGQIVWRRFLRHRGAMVSLLLIALIALLSFSSIGAGPLPGWWKHDPTDQNALVNPLGAPTLGLPRWLGGDGLAWGDAPFGQDTIGRDVFARVMQGAQVSMLVMATVGLTSAVLGTLVGAVAGFYRGVTDQLLMRLTDLVITFPLIVVGAVLGSWVATNKDKWFVAAIPPTLLLAFVIGLVSWTTLARLVRAEFLSLREREFVDAARVAGASDARIMFKHMLPNAIGVILVNTTLLMAAAVILEASLSYLGFGVPGDTTSLGKMIAENEQALTVRPWVFWWPGLFVIALALAINFVGDGARDAFDPRQKKIPSERKMARAARRGANA